VECGDSSPLFNSRSPSDNVGFYQWPADSLLVADPVTGLLAIGLVD
jgi:hypothetical protein